MKALQLNLSEKEKLELTIILKTHPKPYLRERASAILQIAEGKSGLWVSQFGLLVKRRKHTIYDWVQAYQKGGIDALEIVAGRGRKPAFSPSK